MRKTLSELLEECAQVNRERERDRVERWRFYELRRAGWSRALAARVAADAGLDLHEACKLVRAGCAPATALAILA
jgi:hypothetical protein